MTEVRVLAVRPAPSGATALYRADVEVDGLLTVKDVLVAAHGLFDAGPTAQPPFRSNGRPILSWGTTVGREVAAAVIDAAPMMMAGEEASVPVDGPAPNEICPVCLGDWLTCGHTPEQAEAAIAAALQGSEGPDAA